MSFTSSNPATFGKNRRLKEGMRDTYGGVFRAGCYDVFKEGIPLDVQYVALMATNFWVMRVQTASLKRAEADYYIYLHLRVCGKNII